MRTCEFDGCGKPHRARGLCSGHHAQWRKGKLLTPLHLHATVETVAERIRARSTVNAAGCWIWDGPLSDQGYGQLWVGGELIGAHVASFLAFVGEVPAGREVDHRCRMRACVNPSHLRAATRKQNGENRSTLSTNRSGYRGVYWHTASGLWMAAATHNGKKFSAGYFDDVEEAAAAAVQLRRELFTHNEEDRRDAA